MLRQAARTISPELVASGRGTNFAHAIGAAVEEKRDAIPMAIMPPSRRGKTGTRPNSHNCYFAATRL